MARILVTGGAGYIGSHTVRALLSAGHEVAVIDDLSAGHREFLPGGVALEVVDLAEGPVAEVLSRHRPEAIIHFAGAIEAGLSMTDPRRFYRANVTASLALLDAVVESGGGVVVYSSSAAVYGTPQGGRLREDDAKRPDSVYGQTKLDVEHVLAAYRGAYGLRSTSLRYFNAAGAASDASLGEAHRVETHLIPLAIAAALAGTEVSVFGTDYPTPDGTCIRDYVHVEDLARAHVLAVDALLGGAEGAPYNVGVGTGFSVREVLDTVEAVGGRELARREMGRRAGDPAELVADPARITAELGWRPVFTDVEAIVRTAWAWHTSHGPTASAAASKNP
jgi:UDP-glucose 4-epimerase